MRIVYGVQSTGKGHLSRFLGLKPLFDQDGHDLLVIVTGNPAPPRYFLDTIEDVRCERFAGLSMIEDGVGGVSKRGTVKAFATHLPGLLESFYRAHFMISAFDPDLIVSDFDPITGSPFVVPSVPKVGISNHFTLSHPSIAPLPKLKMERFNVSLIGKLFTSGLDVRLGCHFYPIDEACLPPILRPEILSARVDNHGHLVVYHSFHGLLAPIVAYAERNPERPVIVYGYESRPAGTPDNIRFETDPGRFAHDLATCDAYVGTAGFQTICEAFFLGKKLVVQPIAGQYEQKWNAAQLELHGMGRWCRGDLEGDLNQTFDCTLHERLAPWYRDGARACYERILGCVDSSYRRLFSKSSVVRRRGVSNDSEAPISTSPSRSADPSG